MNVYAGSPVSCFSWQPDFCHSVSTLSVKQHKSRFPCSFIRLFLRDFCKPKKSVNLVNQSILHNHSPLKRVNVYLVLIVNKQTFSFRLAGDQIYNSLILLLNSIVSSRNKAVFNCSFAENSESIGSR